MKMFFAALALATALPTVTYAADAPAEKDCCDKMKSEQKKCCCDDKTKQAGTEQRQDHAGHETPSASAQ